MCTVALAARKRESVPIFVYVNNLKQDVVGTVSITAATTASAIIITVVYDIQRGTTFHSLQQNHVTQTHEHHKRMNEQNEMNALK